MFGRSPFATCTFSEYTGIREDHHAVLAASDPAARVDAAQTIVCRVWTRDGSARPAILCGVFRPVVDGADRDRPTFAGRSASLEIISHSRRGIGSFARGHVRIDLAAIRG